jgi:hypothetical protein
MHPKNNINSTTILHSFSSSSNRRTRQNINPDDDKGCCSKINGQQVDGGGQREINSLITHAFDTYLTISNNKTTPHVTQHINEHPALKVRLLYLQPELSLKDLQTKK